MAEELCVGLGEEVGYTIRFEDNTSSRTRIRFLTDGCLLRECLRHRDLEPYSVIVLDEAHERSLNTDILFGIIRALAARRPELKIVITSATLNTKKFSKFFYDCPVASVPGRCYPVSWVVL